MGVQVVVLASLQFAVGERNEATKQALKHESATKTLVDNLLSELAQLRRENAEKTMAAEVMAKEIRRLQPLEQELMSKDRMPLQKHASKVMSKTGNADGEVQVRKHNKKVVEAKKILVAFDKTSTRYCREIPCTSDADCEKRCCDTGCPGASRCKDDQGFWHDSPRTCMPSSQIACGAD